MTKTRFLRELKALTSDNEYVALNERTIIFNGKVSFQRMVYTGHAGFANMNLWEWEDILADMKNKVEQHKAMEEKRQKLINEGE